MPQEDKNQMFHQWLWDMLRWVTLSLVDLNLWLILSINENTRSIRPILRETFPRKDRMFERVKQITSTHESVLEPNHNRSRRQVFSIMPYILIFSWVFSWWIFFVVVTFFWLHGFFTIAFVVGLPLGAAYAGGLYLRAKTTGILDEKLE